MRIQRQDEPTCGSVPLPPDLLQTHWSNTPWRGCILLSRPRHLNSPLKNGNAGPLTETILRIPRDKHRALAECGLFKGRAQPDCWACPTGSQALLLSVVEEVRSDNPASPFQGTLKRETVCAHLGLLSSGSRVPNADCGPHQQSLGFSVSGCPLHDWQNTVDMDHGTTW